MQRGTVGGESYSRAPRTAVMRGQKTKASYTCAGRERSHMHLCGALGTNTTDLDTEAERWLTGDGS